mgnify:CR=1 FL=1
MADEEQTPGDVSDKPTTEMEALMDVEVEITAVLGVSILSCPFPKFSNSAVAPWSN